MTYLAPQQKCAHVRNYFANALTPSEPTIRHYRKLIFTCCQRIFGKWIPENDSEKKATNALALTLSGCYCIQIRNCLQVYRQVRTAFGRISVSGWRRFTDAILETGGPRCRWCWMVGRESEVIERRRLIYRHTSGDNNASGLKSIFRMEARARTLANLLMNITCIINL